MASGRRDLTGSLVGLAVFLGGVALLGLTFSWAHEEFTRPQAARLGLVKGQQLDGPFTGGALLEIVIRLGFLIVMAIVGSLVANKGIGLYAGSLHPVEKGEGKARRKRDEAEPDPDAATL